MLLFVSFITPHYVQTLLICEMNWIAMQSKLPEETENLCCRHYIFIDKLKKQTNK